MTTMIKDDQSHQIAFLSDPDVFADGTRKVDRVTTHASELFIGKDKVLKLKRAVAYPFMDYSTPEKRKVYCEREVDLNRRTAPGLYLGVKPITKGGDGKLHLDPYGDIVDWVVEMRRFDESALFDRLAERNKLSRHLLEHLADIIAAFHDGAEPRKDGGGQEGITLTVQSNAAAFEENAPGILDMARVSMLTERALESIDALSLHLEQRRLSGRVRFCHGDMHLRNIFLQDGEPVLFDGIEFNDTFAIIDVMYDVAFLLMDLDNRGLGTLATVILNRYLDITGDVEGLKVLPLFLSVRAAVRSFVACAAAKSVDDENFKTSQTRDAQRYLDMALRYLDVPKPRLVAVGGLSGSGKSRLGRDLARHIGAAPGARVVRSDVMRKRLCGVHPLETLPPESYTAEMSEKTYQAVFEDVRAVLSTGHSAIADCVFSKPEERQAIADVAAEMGVPFDGFWLEADPDIMKRRVTKRKNNASDADAEVVKLQLGYELGDIGWHKIDSSGSKSETDAQALHFLNQDTP